MSDYNFISGTTSVGVKKVRPTLVHENGSRLVEVAITGTGQYVNIPGFTFHEPLEEYLKNGWRIAE